MTSLGPLPATFAATRDDLQRVAVHIVARARQQATGRFGLRVTAGGFGTPEFGPDLTRVRVSGAFLVRETGGTAGATNRGAAIDGATLADLAAVAAVDLDAALDVGHDTPPLGERSTPLAVDAAAADALARWYMLATTALDRIVVASRPEAAPTLAQLWPEHFDVALDLAATPDRRANVGASPGDAFHPEPYLYVGPWTDDRPGHPEFWNAPFGAVLGYAQLAVTDDPVTVAAAFFDRGLALLAA